MPSADPIPQESNAIQTQSPSPAPEPPPTAQTPGPRATAFLNLYQKTLSTTLRTISYDNFADCFPTIAKNAPENLKGLHKAMIERLEGFAQKDFDALIRERNVIEKLNALEDLIQDASKRKARAVEGEMPPTPPHTLPPTALLLSHLYPTLTSTQSQLNAKLQTTQSQNAQLFSTIQDQRREIEELVGALERNIGDLEAADQHLREEVGPLRAVVGDVSENILMGGV